MQAKTETNQDLNIYYLTEQAVTVEFGKKISGFILDKVGQTDSLIGKKPFPGFIATVPAYATLTVFFDPVQVIGSNLSGADCFEKVSNYIRKLHHEVNFENDGPAEIISIQVCYGSTFGPDINEVAKLQGLSVQEVIRLHCSVVYKVFMIGFVPGFAYLGGMPDLLATPRKAEPRKAVPAGSVGIAGTQTGIYPLETPGGWQIIGRTPFVLFDHQRRQPTLLKAGDQVVFKPISEREFQLICH